MMSEQERRWGYVKRYMSGPVGGLVITLKDIPIQDHSDAAMETRRLNALSNEKLETIVRGYHELTKSPQFGGDIVRKWSGW